MNLNNELGRFFKHEFELGSINSHPNKQIVKEKVWGPQLGRSISIN